MRPGAAGFFKVMVALIALIVVFVAFAAWVEFGTLGEDDPISHYMHDMGKIGVFLFGLGMGTLAASVFWLAVAWAFHFWFEAKARFREQDEYISRHGGPKSGMFAITYKNELWRIHGGGSDA